MKKKNTKSLLSFLAIFGLFSSSLAGLASAADGILEQGSWTDLLEVTIAPTCSFVRDTSARHALGETHPLSSIHNVQSDGTSVDPGGDSSNVAGTWEPETGDGDYKIYEDTLSGTLMGDDIEENFGSSTFRIICNNANGWKVITNATNLTGNTTTTENITLGNYGPHQAGWQYTATTTFTDYVTVPESASTTSGVTIAEAATRKTTGNDGVTFTVQYGVSTDNTISAQTYSGTIEYIFSEIDLQSPENSAPANSSEEPKPEPEQKNTKKLEPEKEIVDESEIDQETQSEEDKNEETLEGPIVLEEPEETPEEVEEISETPGEEIEEPEEILEEPEKIPNVPLDEITEEPKQLPTSTSANPNGTINQNNSSYGPSNSYAAPNNNLAQGSTGDDSASSTNATNTTVPNEEKPLGVSSSTRTKEVESSNNAGLIAALVTTGVLATAAGGIYLYEKKSA